MGNCMRKKPSLENMTLAILGLDNAGKTVTAKGLKGESLDSVAPTIGFTSIDFTFDKYSITMYDLGGGKKIRDIWKNYFSEVYGLVYVIDASAVDRTDECRSVLEKLLENERIAGKPILVLANKQDRPGAMDELDVCEHLDLEELVNKHKTPCRVELCSAVLGKGKKIDRSIKRGMQWLLRSVENNFEALDQRVKKDISVQKDREKQEKKAKAERVRKIREERERKEKEERRLRGEPESDTDMPDPTATGSDPFKQLNRDELVRKEKESKEAKRRSKEARMQRDIDNTATNDLFMDSPSELLKQRHIRSLDDSDIYSQRNKKLPIRDSPRPFRRSSYDRSPSPPGHRDESGDVSSSWQQQRTSKSLDFSSASKLPPLGQGDLSSAPRRNVLTPLGLEPLEGLEKRQRRKKKKARKNQTMPGGLTSEIPQAENAYDEPDAANSSMRGWQTSSARASRSPRLDTVREPENEPENTFSHKWGLVDELPELPEADEAPLSNRRHRPNTDFHEVMT